MKKVIIPLLGLAALFGLARTAGAAASATQDITYEVVAINELSVSNAGPIALTVNAATAGQQPDADTDSSTSYSITTNETNRKITGVLDEDMPANTTLTVNLTAPTVGASAGAQSLSTVARDLVTGITKVADNAGNTIAYSLSATVAAGVVASNTIQVTYTIAAP